MGSTNRSSSNQSSLFLNYLIDAGKKKPASIKWEPVRIDRRRPNPFFNHLIDAGKKKARIDQMGTRTNRPRRIDQGCTYVRTYDQTQTLKDLKVQKHEKTAF